MALPLITQTQLTDELSERTGFPKGEVKHFLSALDALVSDAISSCQRVKVANVTVEPKLRPSRKKRMGRNPATGEEVAIPAKPASVAVKARVGKALQEKAPSTKRLQARL